MAWRPTEYLIEGELDNTHLGKVTGWLRFAGMRRKVRLDLEGDFHRDIRGTMLRLRGPAAVEAPRPKEAAAYMKGFSAAQVGRAGDITAGLKPVDYVDYPYVEWYGEGNGRVVLELDPEQIEVVGERIPTRESFPVSRERQAQNMVDFLRGLMEGLNA